MYRTSDLLTPEEVASALRVVTKTLYEWRRTGEGPRFVRIGRKVFYRAADVDDWLQCRTHVAPAQ